MDYLWKLSSLTSSLTFPFTLEEYLISSESNPQNGWTLQSGYDKKNKERVLIHRLNIRKTTVENVSIARRNVAKCKTLHHPFILKYKYSDEDSENITLVTEYAIPLEQYLNKIVRNDSFDDSISYGVLCILECMDFLHNNAKLQLTNFSLNSIFVTQQLDWKISGFGCCCDIGDRNATQLFNNFARGNDYVVGFPMERFSTRNVDMWSLGCFLYVVYNWENKTKWSSRLNHSILNCYETLPSSIHKFYRKLLQCGEVDLKNEIEHQKQPPGIFSSRAVVFRCQLLNLYLLNDDELVNFFHTYNREIKYVSTELGIFMLFPVLMNFYTFGKLLHIVQPAIICVFVNFLNNSASNNDTTFKYVNHELIKDTIYQLWTSTDRGTRMYLLKSAEATLNYLNDSKNIGKKIVSQYVFGFTDSLLELKLESIKCIPIFVKFLPTNETHSKLLPFLVKVFEETNNRNVELAMLDSFENVVPDLKSDSLKIILKSLAHKLISLSKRPTRVIHDILEFFVKSHRSLDFSLLVCDVLPPVTQLLLCSNQLVRNDAVNCVNNIILYISETVSNPLTSYYNDIYYDTENINATNQQLNTLNSCLTIFDNDVDYSLSNTNCENQQPKIDYLYNPRNNTNIVQHEIKNNQFPSNITNETKNTSVIPTQISDANGWGWNLDLDANDSFAFSQPQPTVQKVQNSVPEENKQRKPSSKQPNTDNLWDDWGDF